MAPIVFSHGIPSPASAPICFRLLGIWLFAPALFASPPLQIDTTRRGIVLEHVDKGSAGAKAVLQQGDIIFGWSCAGAKGVVESPFDLGEVELEYAAKCSVALHGYREGRARTWRIGQSGWGLTARPSLPAEVLSTYQQAQKAANDRNQLEAARLLRHASTLIESTNKTWLAAWFLSQAALLLTQSERAAEGDDLFYRLLNQSPPLDPSVRVQLLESWVETFYGRDWMRAERYCRQELEERRKRTSEGLGIAHVINRLGFIAFNRHDPVMPEDAAEAEQNWRDALAMRLRFSPESLPLAVSFNNVARAAQIHGRLAEAQQFYVKALAIREKIAPETASNLLVNMGALAIDVGDLAAAEEYLHRANAIEERNPGRDLLRVQILNNLGVVSQRRHKPTRAEDYFQQVLALCEAKSPGSMEVAAALDRLASLMQAEGKSQKAEEYLGRALRILETHRPGSVGHARLLTRMALVKVGDGDIPKAREQLSEALRIAERQIPGGIEHADALLGLATVLKASGEFSESSKAFDEGFDILEAGLESLTDTEEQRLDVRSRHARRYRDYIDLLLLDNRPGDAFAVLERSRARLFLAILAERDLLLAS